MRVVADEYRRKPLRVHQFLDVPLHDVTTMRLRGGGEGRTVQDFLALLSIETLQRLNPVVGGLFRLRWALGRLLGWDDDEPQAPGSSYLHRLTDADRADSLVKPGSRNSAMGPFHAVYVVPGEALYELTNATGHYFLLTAMEPSADGYTLYWAVYVRGVSWLTPLYMALIDPLRRFLVYPAMVKHLERAWEERYQ